MIVSAASYTDIGGREANEDALSLIDNGKTVIAIVADGLGGHASGELASRLAVNSIGASLSGWSVSEAALRDAVIRANDEIVQHEGESNLKTTIAVLWIGVEGALAATVGDTRIYQFRDGSVAFRSTDHSIAQVEVNAGNLKPEEVRNSPYRHYLTRALGGGENVKPDIVKLHVKPGDAFLVCSDGVWGEIVEREMLKTLMRSDKSVEWIEQIRECVRRRSRNAGDNHTAIALIANTSEDKR